MVDNGMHVNINATYKLIKGELLRRPIYILKAVA